MRWYIESVSSVCIGDKSTMALTEFTPSNRLYLVLFSAFVLRLLLQSETSLPDLLTSRLEISTPITSFKRCMHLVLYQFTDASERRIVPVWTWCASLQRRCLPSRIVLLYCIPNWQPPLLLAFFSTLQGISPYPELAVHLVFTLVDIASAHFLTVACGDKTEKWKVAAKYLIS